MPRSIDVFECPGDVNGELDLGFEGSTLDPAFTYVEVLVPAGQVGVECRTSGSVGTLAVALDQAGELTLSQDTGGGPQVVDGDTLAERDRPAVGEPVLLGLPCADGQVGDTPYPVVVTATAATHVRTAFVVPARQVLDVE